MFQNKKYLFFLFGIFLSIILFTSVFINNVFASPSISSFLLNGNAQNVTFNPNNGESISIEVKSNTPVKFTRLYICSINQICNGTSGNYTRYFSQTDISDTITKSWNGKKSGDVEIVPEGEYKVMVSMTEGTNSPVTEFGQYSVFVNFSSTNSTTTNSTSSDNTNTIATTTNSVNTPTTSVVIRTVYVSTHSGEEDLSSYDEKDIFQISAGRERMALTGSILEFDAKYILLQTAQCVPNFKWSFGDGFEAVGKNVAHIYKYTGEYQLVLNGSCGEYNSISRTIVKITKPEILINVLDSGDLDIKNNASNEINVGGWKISGISKDFIFPQDTIISARNNIILSKDDLSTNSSSTGVTLVNPSGFVVAYYNQSVTGQVVPDIYSSATNNNAEILSVNTNISSISIKESPDQYKNDNETQKVQNNNISIANNDKKLSINNNNNSNVATVAESIVSTTTKSFWAKLIDVPINGLKNFVRIFYDFE